MQLRYSCFISYQRGNDLVDRFARELFQALSDELGLVTPLPVWFDTARLDAGESWGGASVEALHGSVCMVPVLTPTYFSEERTYCGREYMVMEAIEHARNAATRRDDNVIMPVVLRGAERLPPAIQQRQLRDFSKYFAFGPRQFRSPNFSRSVLQLAEEISRLETFYRSQPLLPEVDPTPPSDTAVREWLSRLSRSLLREPPFPFPTR